DPRPGLLEPYDGLAASVSDAGGGVQDAVSEPFGFGDGEGAVKAEPLRPDGEVLGDQHELQPGVVADDVDAGQVAQPGVFGGAGAVLEVGGVTVAQFEPGNVCVGLVGDEQLMAEAVVEVEQAELGAGMGSLPAGDHPGGLGPGVEVEQLGELGHPGAL